MQIKVVNLSRRFKCDYSGGSVNWAQVSHAKYIQNFVFYPYMSLTSQEDWTENISYNTLRLPAMIKTVLKFPHSKFRFNWTNISLFVPDFLP